MMMGTVLEARSSRHTPRPSRPGSIRSSSTSAGRCRAKASSAARPSCTDDRVHAAVAQVDGQQLGEPGLVLHHQDAGGAVQSWAGGRHVGARQGQGDAHAAQRATGWRRSLPGAPARCCARWPGPARRHRSRGCATRRRGRGGRTGGSSSASGTLGALSLTARCAWPSDARTLSSTWPGASV